MKIGYLTFGRDDFSYGLSLSMRKIDKRHETYRVTPKTARYVDVLFFSCFWWEHIYVMADFLRQAGIDKSQDLKDRPFIIVGGFNSFNPLPLSKYADAVIVGDGEETLYKLVEDLDADLPGVFREGDTDVEYQIVDPLIGYCHETNQIGRVEIARGCRYKCSFCAVTFLKPYREVPVDEVKKALTRCAVKRVALFAPEPTLHSQDSHIDDLCDIFGKTRLDTDIRLDNLGKRRDNMPRVGIEGISYKLRKSVNKPYTDEKIYTQVKKLVDAGRRGLFMYFILDLPGEDEQDWRDMISMFERISDIPGCENFLLKPQPNVFMPSPHTPMEYASIHYWRDYRTKWHKYMSKDGKRGWKIMMCEANRVFGPTSRVLSMVSTRAGYEFYDLDRYLTEKGVLRVRGGRPVVLSLPKLERYLKPFGGTEKYCGEYTKETAPWKVVRSDRWRTE